MELIEIFQVLEIERTKDEEAIKAAYRRKLSVTNPEDNPEGFKRLRTAYEEACRYAKQPEEAEEEEQELTPAGLWAAKAAEIYGRIDSRCDVEAWQALFAEDIFLSLEEEENCRIELLRFLMEHYKLPTEIWKLLDEKLHIVEDAAKLRENFPADFIGFIVSKCERGEDLVFSQFEGAPDANYDLFLRYYDQCWRALEEGQLEQAEEFIKNARDLQIFHPVLEVCQANLFVKQERISEAIDLMLKLKERFPEDVMVVYNTAEMLWENDQKEKAVAVYEGLKELNDKHYMSNVRLTEWHYKNGRYQEAKDCAEKVLSLGPDDEFIELLRKVNQELEKEMEVQFQEEADWRTGLDLCWCYLQDGAVHKGICLALKLEKKIPAESQAEYNGLLSKLYVEGADYRDALSMCEVWEKSLLEKLPDDDEEEAQKDRDRIRQSHTIRMQCHKNLGYVDANHFWEAIKEAEWLETGSAKDAGLLLEKARIYMELEEYEQSLELTQRLIEDYQIYAAYATAMEVYRRQWNARGVVDCAQQCIYYFPNYARAYELIAKVFLDLEYTEDLKRVLEDAEQNGVKSVILDAYRYQMEHEVLSEEEIDERMEEFTAKYRRPLVDGQINLYLEGLPIITEYLYCMPDTYMLQKRAHFHKEGKNLEAAREDFEKALEENPAEAYAYNGLAYIYGMQGDYEKALIYIKKTILYMGEEVNPIAYADIGIFYSVMGDYERALPALRMHKQAAEENEVKYPYFLNDLSSSLMHFGLVEEAMEVLEDAYAEQPIRFSKQVFYYHVTGREAEAQECLQRYYEELVNKKDTVKGEDFAEYYDCMGWQELIYGSVSKAQEYFAKSNDYLDSEEDRQDYLCNAIFGCILAGDEERGRLYADCLCQDIEKAEKEGIDTYYKRDRMRCQRDFFAYYYKWDTAKLETLFDNEETFLFCRGCISRVCKEMESARILLMLRKGEKEAALAYLEECLRKEPYSVYFQALYHAYANEGNRGNK